eukprot:623941-Pelagomonas_calceolata.AAC.1
MIASGRLWRRAGEPVPLGKTQSGMARDMFSGHKLTSTRRVIENKNTHHNTGALEQRAARNPPDPH